MHRSKQSAVLLAGAMTFAGGDLHPGPQDVNMNDLYWTHAGWLDGGTQ